MKKYAVGIDARMLQHTGIGTYLQGLLTEFSSLHRQAQNNICVFGPPGFSGRYPSLAFRAFQAPIYSAREQMHYLWQAGRCRLWHAPHYNVPYFPRKTKLVVTIHDIIHWVFRKNFLNPLQTFYAGTMLRRALRRADHVITVSKKTKQDLIDHFDADAEKISVIYEGVGARFTSNPESGAPEKLRQKYKLPEKFFLYVGMIKPHKNVLWLIHTFEKLRAQGRLDAGLVLVGKLDKQYPAGYEELGRPARSGLVYHLPYVESAELEELYRGAIALVHPSLYEGFGLTLLEAMASGTPVIACRAASVPEITGDAALLVDSCAEHEIMDAIVRIEKSPALRADYARRGELHARKFRWSDCAEKTANVYEKVLNS